MSYLSKSFLEIIITIFFMDCILYFHQQKKNKSDEALYPSFKNGRNDGKNIKIPNMTKLFYLNSGYQFKINPLKQSR